MYSVWILTQNASWFLVERGWTLLLLGHERHNSELPEMSFTGDLELFFALLMYSCMEIIQASLSDNAAKHELTVLLTTVFLDV